MRLFYGFLSFFLLVFPFVRWYLHKNNRVPNFFNIHGVVIIIVVVCYLMSMLLHLWLPTFREHIEPGLTDVSLMFLAGFPVYPPLSDPNVYSLLYGPNTYLLQAGFLKIFSNPIFAVKLYGITCILSGMAVLYYAINKKFNRRIASLGLFYYSAIALLFGQVSFRNHADCTIFLGSTLAVASVLLPSSWVSMLLLAAGSAVAINAKFHSAAFIIPLLIMFYRQHGLTRLCITAAISVALTVLPFTLDLVNFSNFIAILSVFSNIWLHPISFVHNFWMSLTIMLPVVYLFYVEIKSNNTAGIDRDIPLTFALLCVMVVGVSIVGSVDGGGIHHIAPFAPVFSVLLVMLYSRNKDRLDIFMANQGIRFKAVCMTAFIAWFASMLTFTYSMQKKIVQFASENYSHEVRDEVLAIRNMLIDKNWQVLMGYTDHPNHKYTFYRSLLWPVTKGNIVDPSVLAGRQAGGLKIPDSTIDKFSKQYFDVILLPKNGKPFNMDNWHNRKLMLFGEKLPLLFEENYYPWKKYKYFVLWRAKRLS